MATGHSGSGDRGGPIPRRRRRGGYVMLKLPRYVVAKPLKGRTAFYFAVPTIYRRAGCPIPCELLGADYGRACERAAALNALFDEWRTGKVQSSPGAPRFGTVGWLFREYKASENYRLRVSARTRPDYDRTMALVADFHPKRGAKIGARPVR